MDCASEGCTVEVSPAAARFVSANLLRPTSAFVTIVGLVRECPLSAGAAVTAVAVLPILGRPLQIALALLLAVGAVHVLLRLPRGKKYGIGVRDSRGRLVAGLRFCVDEERRVVTLIGLYVNRRWRRRQLAGSLIGTLLRAVSDEIGRNGSLTVNSYLPVHPASRRLVEKLGALSVTYVSAAAADAAHLRLGGAPEWSEQPAGFAQIWNASSRRAARPVLARRGYGRG